MDSELATTLAQGKPVVAYIPRVSELEDFNKDTINQIQMSYGKEPTKDQVIESLLKRLQRYYPTAAWERQDVRNWVEDRSQVDIDALMQLLHQQVIAMYDKRADTLSKIQPLGLQVNLSTGVANGVLVVRSVKDCARLLSSILLNTMEFNIEDTKGYVLLREGICKCIYRAVTKDSSLTNAF